MDNHMPAKQFLEDLSSASPTPGGGGASALAGALAAALGMMVCNLTAGKKKYADVEDDVKACCDRLEGLRDRLFGLIDEDARAFSPLAEAYRLPASTEEEKAHKAGVMEEALKTASSVPFAIMEASCETLKVLAILEKKGSRLAVSDVGCGAILAGAAAEAASLNVYINTHLMKDSGMRTELNEKTAGLAAACRSLSAAVSESVAASII